MVWHTLAAFRALAGRIASIALVVAPDDGFFEPQLPRFPGDGEHLLRVGGATRAASGANGLRALRQRRRHRARLGAGARRRALPDHADADRRA